MSQSSYNPEKRRERHRRLYDSSERKRRHLRTYCSACQKHHKSRCDLALSDSSESMMRDQDPPEADASAPLKGKKRSASVPPPVSALHKKPRLEKEKPIKTLIESDDNTSSLEEEDLAPSEFLTEDDVERLKHPLCDISVTQEDKKRIRDEFNSYFSDDSIGRDVCCCCDRLTFRRDTQTFSVAKSAVLIHSMQAKLVPQRELPKRLRDFYSVYNGKIGILEFHGLLMSKKGVNYEKQEFFLCKQCHGSIKAKTNKPPKYSIANFNEIGDGAAPQCINDLNNTETTLVSPFNLYIKYDVLSGGPQTSLSNHVMSFENNVSELVDALPRKLNSTEDLKFKVVLCGPFTTDQEASIRSRHEVSRDRIDAGLNFLTGSEDGIPNNTTLFKFKRDDQALQEVPEIPSVPDDLIVKVDENDDLKKVSKAASSNIAEPLKAKEAVSETSEKVTGSTFIKINPISDDDALRTYAIRKSSRLVKDHEDKLFCKNFIKLYAFGRGDPSEDRPVKLSKKECIARTLMLSSQMHAKDQTFILAAFDILSRDDLLSSVRLRAELSLSDNQKIAEVSPDMMEILLKYEAACTLASGKGESLPPLPQQLKDDDSAKVFARTITATTGAIFATNEQRKIIRDQMQAAKIKHGSVHLMFTIAMNDRDCSIQLYFATASEKKLLHTSDASELNISPSDRLKLTGDNPVAAALYFNEMMKFVEGSFFGIDGKTGLSKKLKGLFGNIQAYMGMVEAQGRGTLHAHVLVWVHGLPDTFEKFDRYLSENSEKDGNNLYSEKITKYADSIVQTGIALDTNQLSCPKCLKCTPDGFTPLQEISPIPNKAYFKLTSVMSAPNIYTCLICKEGCSAETLLRHRIKVATDDLNNLKKDINFDTSDKNTEQWMRSIDAVYNTDTADPSQVLIDLIKTSIIQLQCVEHDYHHRDSCFKDRKSCLGCRYSIPHETTQRLTRVVDGILVLSRSIGSNYITAHNEMVLRLFKCNNDVKILLGLGTADIEQYCVNYATKDQHVYENYADLVATTLAKKKQKEKEMENTTKQKMVKNTLSVDYKISESQEICSNLAALYLLYKDLPLYTNMKFENLLLPQFLNAVKGEDLVVALQRITGGGFVTTTQWADYTLRPLSLAEISLYVFVECYLKAAIPLISKRQGGDGKKRKSLNENDKMLVENPQRDTHFFKEKARKTVPRIIGPRMPPNPRGASAKKNTPSIAKASEEKYGLIGLILFKPFRSRQDLLDGKSSFYEAFEAFKVTKYFTSDVKTYLDHMEDYYVGRDKAHKTAKKRSDDRKKELAENKKGLKINNEFSNSSDDEEKKELSDDENHSELMDSYIEAIGIKDSEDPKKCTSLESLTKTGLIEQMATFKMNLNGSSRNTPWAYSLVLENVHSNINQVDSGKLEEAFRNLKASLKTASGLEESLEADTGFQINVKADLPKVNIHIDELKNCLSDALNKKAIRPEVLDKTYVIYQGLKLTLEEICLRFTLNAKQALAFDFIGKFLIRKWMFRLDESLELPEQIRMIIHGEGGTGKSEIIKALNALALAWARETSIKLLGTTGIAAVNIEGETVHSGAGIYHSSAFKGKEKKKMKSSKKKNDNGKLTAEERSERKKEKARQDVRQLWAHVDIIILDEMSMLSKSILAQLDARLRFLRMNDKPFGGISLVLCGDFCQFDPVCSSPLFRPPELKASMSEVERLEDEGYRLYSSIDASIVLVENMRHLKDPEYGKIMKRIRLCKWDEEVVKYLNQRHAPNLTQVDIKTFANAPILSNGNQIVSQISRALVASRSSLGDYPMRIEGIFCRKEGKEPSEIVEKQLCKLSPNKFQFRPPVLHAYRNMEVMSGINQDTQLKIANGTVVKIWGYQFPKETTFELKADDIIGGAFAWYPSKKAEIIYVQNEGKLSVPKNFEGIPGWLPSDVYPIFPSSSKSVDISLKDGNKIKYKLLQFPLVDSCTRTFYKVQALTMDKLILTNFEWYGNKWASWAAPYVVFSRARSIKDILLLEPLDATEMKKRYNLPEDLISELDRLEKMESNYFFSGPIVPLRPTYSYSPVKKSEYMASESPM